MQNNAREAMLQVASARAGLPVDKIIGFEKLSELGVTTMDLFGLGITFKVDLTIEYGLSRTTLDEVIHQLEQGEGG
jgi:hypothetical protein